MVASEFLSWHKNMIWVRMVSLGSLGSLCSPVMLSWASLLWNTDPAPYKISCNVLSSLSSLCRVYKFPKTLVFVSLRREDNRFVSPWSVHRVGCKRQGVRSIEAILHDGGEVLDSGIPVSPIDAASSPHLALADVCWNGHCVLHAFLKKWNYLHVLNTPRMFTHSLVSDEFSTTCRHATIGISLEKPHSDIGTTERKSRWSARTERHHP